MGHSSCADDPHTIHICWQVIYFPSHALLAWPPLPTMPQGMASSPHHARRHDRLFDLSKEPVHRMRERMGIKNV